MGMGMEMEMEIFLHLVIFPSGPHTTSICPSLEKSILATVEGAFKRMSISPSSPSPSPSHPHPYPHPHPHPYPHPHPHPYPHPIHIPIPIPIPMAPGSCPSRDGACITFRHPYFQTMLYSKIVYRNELDVCIIMQSNNLRPRWHKS